MINMVTLAEILEEIGPWDVDWQQTEFNGFKSFMQTLKLWAETSFTLDIREETRYPEEILPSPEEEAQSRRAKDAVTNPKISPEYKEMYDEQQRYLSWLWRLTNQNTANAINILKKEELAELALAGSLDFDTLKSIEVQSKGVWKSVPLQMERLYPSNISTEDWRDENDFSWRDYKRIMTKTLKRLLTTQKDVDYIGKPIADYLSADQHWMINTTSGQVEDNLDGWQLLLNPPPEIEQWEVYRILYQQDALNDMIGAMIPFLYRFDIWEPLIKLDQLTIHSHYTSTDDEEAMYEELSNEEQEFWDRANDDELSMGDFYEEELGEPRIPVHQSKIDWKYEDGEFGGSAKGLLKTESAQGINRLVRVEYPVRFNEQVGKIKHKKYQPTSNDPWFPYGIIKDSSELAYYTKGERPQPLYEFTATPYTLESSLVWYREGLGGLVDNVLKAAKYEKDTKPSIPNFDHEEVGMKEMDIKVTIKLKQTGLRFINYVLGNHKMAPLLSTK